MTPTPLDDILAFAIRKEQEAHDFYMDLAGTASSDAMSEVFREFAAEEAGHKAKLEAVGRGDLLLDSPAPVRDLKIADYLVEQTPGPDMTYQQALILAMQQEKAAFRLYSDMAATAVTPEVRNLLRALAQEEAKHKLRFEIEYDELLMNEN